MDEITVTKKSGMATAALVLGIVGVCLAFIPIVNYSAIILGVIGFALALASFIKKAGIGKAVTGLILSIAAITIAVVMNFALVSAVDSAVDEASKNLDMMSGKNTAEVLKNVDVKLGEFVCTKDDLGLTDTKLEVTVTNKLKEKKSFSITIEAVDESGNRIEDDIIYANDLNGGQSQKFEAFTLVNSDLVDKLTSAKFKVLEASMI